MSSKKYKAELFDEKIIDKTDYTERVRIYKCPCGKGKFIWSKERPNGGSGYQATFSDHIWQCEDCKLKYKFSTLGHFEEIE